MDGYLIINGLIFLIVGFRALLNPIGAVAEPYSLQADHVDGRNYLRSGAGGVTVAAGAVLLAAPFVPPLDFAALLLAVTLFAGLVFGRLVSLVLDGSPGPTPWIAGTIELVGLLFGAYWLFEALS